MVYVHFCKYLFVIIHFLCSVQGNNFIGLFPTILCQLCFRSGSFLREKSTRLQTNQLTDDGNMIFGI